MTVEELGERMSNAEYVRWRVFYEAQAAQAEIAAR